MRLGQIINQSIPRKLLDITRNLHFLDYDFIAPNAENLKKKNISHILRFSYVIDYNIKLIYFPNFK